MADRRIITVFSVADDIRGTAQIMVVSVEAIGWLSLGALDFRLFELWSNGTNRADRYLVL